ncbi:MAG: hypothetical protein LQ351_005190 [Letrouitia transgressa]|nr:MAG: hypothetical protein LQ351_005190 [Letrouitia transgressa]
MSAQQSADPTYGGTVTDPAQTVAKGKGKAVDEIPQDVSMDEDEDSSEEETGPEDEPPEPEEEDEDNMEEIDTDNIITSGRRTRGKSIDFNKVDDGGYPDDDDDDDDDDFEEPDDRDAMEE